MELVEIVRVLDGIPNCPFFTSAVSIELQKLLRTLTSVSDRYDASHFSDAYGLYWRVRTRNTFSTPVALVTHMDHPGIVFDKKGKGVPLGSIGGIGVKRANSILQKTAEVRLFSPNSDFLGVRTVMVYGESNHFQLIGDPPALDETVGIWNVGVPVVHNGELHCRSADNHVATAIALKALEHLITLNVDFDLTLIFPSLEEIYQLSMTELCIRGGVSVLDFDEDVVFLVLESMEMLWSEVHERFAMQHGLQPPTYSGGPLVKVNDSMAVYGCRSGIQSNMAESALVNAGLNLRIPFQNTVSAGVTDATALSSIGSYPHIAGLAVPCRNKHNISPQGRVVREVVSVRDIEDSVKMLVGSIINLDTPMAVRGISSMLRQSNLCDLGALRVQGKTRLELLRRNRPRIESGFFLPTSLGKFLRLTGARLGI